MTIEEASEKLDETMKAVANRAFKASQLSDDWPDTLKLAALDSELGEVPSWPAAKRALALAVLDEADVGFDDPLEGGGDMKCEDCAWDSGPYSLPCEKHSKLGALRRRIEELGK